MNISKFSITNVEIIRANNGFVITAMRVPNLVGNYAPKLKYVAKDYAELARILESFIEAADLEWLPTNEAEHMVFPTYATLPAGQASYQEMLRAQIAAQQNIAGGASSIPSYSAQSTTDNPLGRAVSGVDCNITGIAGNETGAVPLTFWQRMTERIFK